MSAVAIVALSVFPVFLDCSGMVILPRPNRFEHRRIVFADQAVEFEPKFAALTGVGRAKGRFNGKVWEMNGTERERTIALSLLVPSEKQGRFGLDWKTTARTSAGEVVHSSGVGECRMINPEAEEFVR